MKHTYFAQGFLLLILQYLSSCSEAINITGSKNSKSYLPHYQEVPTKDPVSYLFNTKKASPTVYSVQPGWYDLLPNVVATIRSPNYGQAVYPSRVKQTWRFYGKDNCQLTISCPCFRLENSVGCKNDYLLVYGKWDFSRRYCGLGDVVRNKVVSSNGDFLAVQFATNEMGRDSGFVCNVMCDAPDLPRLASPCVTPDNVDYEDLVFAPGTGSVLEPTRLPPIRPELTAPPSVHLRPSQVPPTLPPVPSYAPETEPPRPAVISTTAEPPSTPRPTLPPITRRTTHKPSLSTFFSVKQEPQSCKCGVRGGKGTSPSRVGRVRGGREGEADELPWVVAIFREDPDSGDMEFKCAGTLLSDQHVITDFQCISHPISSMRIIMGANDLLAVPARLYWNRAVETVRPLLGSGLALLTFEAPVEMGAQAPSLRPICVPQGMRNENAGGQWALVAGWGIDGDQPVGSKLRVGSLRIHLGSDCRQNLKPGVWVSDKEGCTDDSPHLGPCSMDVGAPVMVEQEGILQLVGIMRRPSCQESPSVFTLLVEHADEIRKEISSAVTCST